jgi:hypothetical protein
VAECLAGATGAPPSSAHSRCGRSRKGSGNDIRTTGLMAAKTLDLFAEVANCPTAISPEAPTMISTRSGPR